MAARAYWWGMTSMVLAGILTGCASTGDPEAIKGAMNSGALAYSIKATPELTVAVSPAGRTLRIAGSAGTIVGIGVDAVANDRYRRQISEAIEGYDMGELFTQHLAERIEESVAGEERRVAPMGSSAGFSSPEAAEARRFEAVAGNGSNALLDLDLDYGLYGFEGTLVTKLEGDLYSVPNGHTLWRKTIVVSTAEILGVDKLTDPTSQFGPNFSSPRLTVSEDAIAQWTGDGGAIVRNRFEEAVNGITSALLCELGVVREAEGYYYLARADMNDKRFARAIELFQEALVLDPDNASIRNGLAVCYGHADRLDEALDAATALTEDAPEFGPGWMNLAWIHAVLRDEMTEGKAAYDKALSMGMPSERKIEKALGIDD